MSLWQRIKNVLQALSMIACALILFLDPEDGYAVVLILFGLSMTLRGISTIGYYFTMTRHMVGGKRLFYAGVILIDIGLFTLALFDSKLEYVMLYLMAICLFKGLVDILRALEAKRLEEGSWKRGLSRGLLEMVIFLICLVFIQSTNLCVYVYAGGMFYSACVRIASAFHREKIVYIQ